MYIQIILDIWGKCTTWASIQFSGQVDLIPTNWWKWNDSLLTDIRTLTRTPYFKNIPSINHNIYTKWILKSPRMKWGQSKMWFPAIIRPSNRLTKHLAIWIAMKMANSNNNTNIMCVSVSLTWMFKRFYYMHIIEHFTKRKVIFSLIKKKKITYILAISKGKWSNAKENWVNSHDDATQVN